MREREIHIMDTQSRIYATKITAVLKAKGGPPCLPTKCLVRITFYTHFHWNHTGLRDKWSFCYWWLNLTFAFLLLREYCWSQLAITLSPEPSKRHFAKSICLKFIGKTAVSQVLLKCKYKKLMSQFKWAMTNLPRITAAFLQHTASLCCCFKAGGWDLL